MNLNEYYGGRWGTGIRFSEMKTELNSPTMIKVAETFRQLYAFAPPGTMQNAGAELFGTDKNNIAINLRANPANARNVQLLNLDARYGIARLFVHPTTKRGSLFVGSPAAIGSSCKVKDAAWEWLKFTASNFFTEYFWEKWDRSVPPVIFSGPATVRRWFQLRKLYC
jgi:ABC-type glycerol-3-phosphate transport system substrate-binding protein